jgi:hypothetical protein
MAPRRDDYRLFRNSAEQKAYFDELEKDQIEERVRILRNARFSVKSHGAVAKARKPQRGKRRRRYWR